MRIVLDLQGSQSDSRFRGIGRYSLSLARAIARNAQSHDVHLVLNSACLDTIEFLRAEFDALIPSGNFHTFDITTPVWSCYPKNSWRVRAAEVLREHFIAALQPDIVHVSSLFEGWRDNAVTSIRSRQAVPTVVTLYDLIPLMDSEKYFTDKQYKAFYERKVDSLMKADALLAISRFTMQEASRLLGDAIPETHYIGSAVDGHFTPSNLDREAKEKFFARLGIGKPYILTSANIEPHKNLKGLLAAFATFSKEMMQQYNLVIVGRIPGRVELEEVKKQAKRLGLPPDFIVFSDYIPDEELVLLYSYCHLFVLPSLFEGFGLPLLEAMKCGAPTIGSDAASIPEVVGMPQAMFDSGNTAAMAEKLRQGIFDPDFRGALIENSRCQAEKFSWNNCAKAAIGAYEQTAEKRHTKNVAVPMSFSPKMQIEEIAEAAREFAASESDLMTTALAIAQNQGRQGKPRLLVDISSLVNHDARTGIQRVVRSVLSELLSMDGLGYSVRAVYEKESVYRFANLYMFERFAQDVGDLSDTVMDAFPGDVFLGLDLHAAGIPNLREFFWKLKDRGVRLHFIVYDLLPVLHPQWFDAGLERAYSEWIVAVCELADSNICISRAVAGELFQWIRQAGMKRLRPLDIGYFHLGADLENSLPSSGKSDEELQLLERVSQQPTFLMVGTIEPRKGHMQVLEAFENLWLRGHGINLVIVGKRGWNVKKVIDRLISCSKNQQQLQWFENISDEVLLKLYQSSSALIMASEGEGFGLPLVESAQRGLPIISRDLPVFREVAGENAFYFSGSQPEDLARSVEEWLELKKENVIPGPEGLKCLTWGNSVAQLLDAVLKGQSLYRWLPQI